MGVLTVFWRPLRERSRARAVKAIGIGEGPSEPDFDRFVQQAAEAFAAPFALLTLIERNSLWIKAAAGLELRCMPRENSFCSHAVDTGDLLEVCDARADPMFAALPAVVGEPYVRYYLGAPLGLMDGTDIGALCVLDDRPRQPASRDQKAYLAGLARQAVHALERRAHVKGGLPA